MFARPVWGIERKTVGFRFRVGNAGCRAHEELAIVLHLSRIVVQHHNGPFAELHGQMDAIGHPHRGILRDIKRIDCQFDIVYFIAVNLHIEEQFAHRAVDAHAGETLFTQILKEFFIVSFASFHDRGQQCDVALIILRQNQVNEFLFGIVDHFFSGIIRIGIRHAGIQKSQKIIYFCNRTHRGTRIFVDRFLLNGDHRVKSGYLVHIGMFQMADKLAGVRGERFHIPALSFGINGIECQ